MTTAKLTQGLIVEASDRPGETRWYVLDVGGAIELVEFRDFDDFQARWPDAWQTAAENRARRDDLTAKMPFDEIQALVTPPPPPDPDPDPGPGEPSPPNEVDNDGLGPWGDKEAARDGLAHVLRRHGQAPTTDQWGRALWHAFKAAGLDVVIPPDRHARWEILNNIVQHRTTGHGLPNPWGAEIIVPGNGERVQVPRGAILVLAPELGDWSGHSDANRGFGINHMIEFRTDKVRNAHGITFEIGEDLDNDQRLQQALPALMRYLIAEGLWAHFWYQGGNGLPRADYQRAMARIDEFASVVREFEGHFSIGYGFDNWEVHRAGDREVSTPGANVGNFAAYHSWVRAMQAELPRTPIGGRPQGPNSRNNPDMTDQTLLDWTGPGGYFSFEEGKPDRAYLVRMVMLADALGLTAMAENRDRMHNEPYYSFTASELAAVIRLYRSLGIVGLVGNWEFKAQRGRRTGPMPHTVYEAMTEPVG